MRDWVRRGSAFLIFVGSLLVLTVPVSIVKGQYGGTPPGVGWDSSMGGAQICNAARTNCVISGQTYTAMTGGVLVMAYDTILLREAANTLALKNGTNAQTLNIYNTFTDASNYERGFLRWNSNAFEIGTANLGSGSARDLKILASSNVQILPTNGVIAIGGSNIQVSDDVATLGNAGKFTHLYLARSIQGSKTKTINDASATAFVRLALPQTLGSNFTSGVILWHLHCDNGSVTTYADRSGETEFSCNNISGTEACVFDATAQQVTQAATYSLAAPTFTATGGTDTVDLNVNADCAGVTGPTNFYIHYRLNILDPQTVTPQ